MRRLESARFAFATAAMILGICDIKRATTALIGPFGAAADTYLPIVFLDSSTRELEAPKYLIICKSESETT